MGYPFSICSLFSCPLFPILSLFFFFGGRGGEKMKLPGIAETAFLKNKVKEPQWVQPLTWGEVRSGTRLAEWGCCVIPSLNHLSLGTCLSIISMVKQAGLTLLSSMIHLCGTEYRPSPLLNSATGWKVGSSAVARRRIWSWILHLTLEKYLSNEKHWWWTFLKGSFPAKFPVVFKVLFGFVIKSRWYQAFPLTPKAFICSEYRSCHLMIYTPPAL